MATVFVSYPIPDEGLALLREAGHEVRLGTFEGDRMDPAARASLLEGVKGADAILPLLTDRIDDEVLDAAGDQLQIVANYAVGFDNIDLAAAASRGVVVTNTPGVLTQTVAEHAMSLVMAVSNNIVSADAFTRAGKYKGWQPDLFLGSQLHRKTIGIVGAGRIGYTVAKIAREGFDMVVKYMNRSANRHLEEEFGATQCSLEELAEVSDVLSIHLPLTNETRHLINADVFRRMKPTAYLVNTARGPIVDEAALVEALQAGELAGAGLDVFEYEPDVHPGLVALENVVLTPHIGSATIEARTEMARLAAKNIVQVLAGKKAVSPVRSG